MKWWDWWSKKHGTNARFAVRESNTAIANAQMCQNNSIAKCGTAMANLNDRFNFISASFISFEMTHAGINTHSRHTYLHLKQIKNTFPSIWVFSLPSFPSIALRDTQSKRNGGLSWSLFHSWHSSILIYSTQFGLWVFFCCAFRMRIEFAEFETCHLMIRAAHTWNIRIELRDNHSDQIEFECWKECHSNRTVMNNNIARWIVECSTPNFRNCFRFV